MMKSQMVKVNKEAQFKIIQFHKLSQKEQTAVIMSLQVCVERHEANEPRLLLATNIRYHIITRNFVSKMVVRFEYCGKQIDYHLCSTENDENVEFAIDSNHHFFALYYWGGFDMDWIIANICDVDCSFIYKK